MGIDGRQLVRNQKLEAGVCVGCGSRHYVSEHEFKFYGSPWVGLVSVFFLGIGFQDVRVIKLPMCDACKTYDYDRENRSKTLFWSSIAVGVAVAFIGVPIFAVFFPQSSYGFLPLWISLGVVALGLGVRKIPLLKTFPNVVEEGENFLVIDIPNYGMTRIMLHKSLW